MRIGKSKKIITWLFLASILLFSFHVFIHVEEGAHAENTCITCQLNLSKKISFTSNSNLPFLEPVALSYNLVLYKEDYDRKKDFLPLCLSPRAPPFVFI